MPSCRFSISTVGLIGFGAFGRLAARHLQGHVALRVFDPARTIRPDDSGMGLRAASLAEAATCDAVILAVPVDALPSLLVELRPHLRAGTLMIDVGSVKLGPAATMLALLPEDVDILGTHPLFGPQSARDGIAGLKIALCPLRGAGAWPIGAFLRRVLKLDVVMTTPDAHDREVALAQGLTHLIAKILVQMEPLPRRMTTASFDLLMRATEMVRHDAPGVFLAIEQANPHARAVRDRFFTLADEMRAHLDGDGMPHDMAPLDPDQRPAAPVL